MKTIYELERWLRASEQQGITVYYLEGANRFAAWVGKFRGEGATVTAALEDVMLAMRENRPVGPHEPCHIVQIQQQIVAETNPDRIALLLAKALLP